MEVFIIFFVDVIGPQLWPEGSYELGSVFLSFHPSVLPFGGFLEIGSLVFSETQHAVRGPYLVVCDRVGFFLKNIFAPKMGKMGQKWAKTGFFEFIGKLSH